jgi:hypothetical protein
MHIMKRWLLLINIVGGAAVLGSYAWGFEVHPGSAGALWGGTPQVWQRISAINMLLAALGYFAFTIFILFRIDTGHTRLFGRFDYRLFCILYAAILLPSALWMPLTLAAMAAPGVLIAWGVRLLLAFIGLASLGLLFALMGLEPGQKIGGYSLALAGCVAFCLQTVVMDAVVWSASFNP